ncbi:MAG TPA: NAD(P)H-dependent glycerol-3-phosphate dehydrogenase [Bryobacteraceae bacterium]|nr:NAD(P)H-dependent glycerol-3-phosphate dehydrogenase [Bryobacteraceae bacterium]HPT27351.1 NAD(P)H-dependent glycerol-3-phosphate dehydrogenase [Bryobacteraceae bacterium]
MNRLAVIGAGSWGTALALTLAQKHSSVRLWVYEADLAESINRTRANDVFLPGFTLPGNVEAGTDLAWTVDEAETVLGVMPSHHARSIYSRLAPHVAPDMLFVSATKGLEQDSLRRISEVIGDVIKPRFTPRVGVLSGPTFAREIARGEPAAIVISSSDAELARTIQQRFAGPSWRLYTNADPVGVEIGAALKNVIAIAAGVCAGLGLGANTMAALITRGLAEITRLAVAAGGSARTLAGLAGLGDLVLTCNGELSRNRSVGYQLGQGKSLEQILSGMRMVAEGVQTTSAAVALAARHGVEVPIAAQMHAVLYENKPARAALRDLMERSLKEE